MLIRLDQSILYCTHDYLLLAFWIRYGILAVAMAHTHIPGYSYVTKQSTQQAPGLAFQCCKTLLLFLSPNMSFQIPCTSSLPFS